jgi:hypothetical protein
MVPEGNPKKIDRAANTTVLRVPPVFQEAIRADAERTLSAAELEGVQRLARELESVLAVPSLSTSTPGSIVK